MRSLWLRTATAVALALAVTACSDRAAGDDAASSPAAAEAAAFLERNAREEGVQVLPSGVQYKVVRSGPADGQRPGAEDMVKVHYEGALIDGTVFDSSYERGAPAVFESVTGLIPAWEEAIPMMRVGDEWLIYVPPEQGYGAEGQGPIPPHSVLVFRVELLGFVDKSEGPVRG